MTQDPTTPPTAEQVPWQVPMCLSRRYEAIVSWDCEYVANARGTANRLLSYQLAWVLPRIDGPPEVGHAMWWPSLGKARPHMADLVALVPPAKRQLWVAHNGLAEVAHLHPDDVTTASHVVAAVAKVPVTMGPWWRMGSCLVHLRDTMLLAPAGGKRLKDIAATNEHHAKIDLDDALVQAGHVGLTPGAIGRMDRVLAEAPGVFREYAMFDVWATLEYYLTFQSRGQTEFGLDKPSMTAVGLSLAAYTESTPEYKDLFGVQQVKEPDEYGRRKSTAAPTPDRAMSEVLATRSVKGGLNTNYHWGWHDGPVIDIDMAGAYASAMAAARDIKWSTARSTKSLGALLRAAEAGHYVWAHVTFNYGRRAPYQTTLADKYGGYGLIYTTEGQAYATGHELLAAHQAGCALTVHNGATYEAGDHYLFASHIAKLTARRAEAKAKGDTFGDLLYKLANNGLYGKLLQGLGVRLTSKVRVDDVQMPMRRSTLTSPQYGSHITALVRTALTELVNLARDLGMVPLNATTDGAMVACPGRTPDDAFQALDKAYRQGRCGALLVEGRRRLGQADALTVKDTADRALSVRTRVNTMWGGPDGATVKGGAWTGWRGNVPPEDRKQAMGNDMAKAFAGGGKRMLQVQRRLPSPLKVLGQGEAYVMFDAPKTLRVCPDYKRRHLPDGSSVAWHCTDDYMYTRKLADRLRDKKHPGTPYFLSNWPPEVKPPKFRRPECTGARYKGI